MRFDPQSNVMNAGATPLPDPALPASLGGGRSPVKTALVILGISCVLGIGLWFTNEKIPGFFDVKALEEPRQDAASAEVVKYAEAVIAGKLLDGGDAVEQRADINRRNRKSKVSRTFSSGQQALSMGRNVEAVQYFTEVVRMDPRHSAARYKLGLAYVRTGDLESARVQYNELKATDPDKANLLKHLIRH
jgi:tetratricopeptide (TPR) repeat protein